MPIKPDESVTEFVSRRMKYPCAYHPTQSKFGSGQNISAELIRKISLTKLNRKKRFDIGIIPLFSFLLTGFFVNRVLKWRARKMTTLEESDLV